MDLELWNTPQSRKICDFLSVVCRGSDGVFMTVGEAPLLLELDYSHGLFEGKQHGAELERLKQRSDLVGLRQYIDRHLTASVTQTLWSEVREQLDGAVGLHAPGVGADFAGEYARSRTRQGSFELRQVMINLDILKSELKRLQQERKKVLPRNAFVLLKLALAQEVSLSDQEKVRVGLGISTLGAETTASADVGLDMALAYSTDQMAVVAAVGLKHGFFHDTLTPASAEEVHEFSLGNVE